MREPPKTGSDGLSLGGEHSSKEEQADREHSILPEGNSEFDFSCFEEAEEEEDLDHDLDPASFRQFVEDAAEKMSSSGSITGLTASNSAHSLEAASENAPSENRPEQQLLSAHTRLGYNQLVGQDAWLVISVAPPFSILAASPAWTEVFGFKEKEIVGRSMRIIQGPQTNVRDLSQGIKKTTETGTPFQAAFMFYTKRMEARMMTIDVTPETEDDDESEDDGPEQPSRRRVTHAVVTMDHSDWVPKKIANAEDNRVKAVVLADKPHSVVSISNSFSELYQLQESMIVGRTMRAIFGPKTNEALFRNRLSLAKTGKTQNLDLWTCRADVSQVHMHVTLFPVLDDATISHVMVVFKEIPDHEGEFFSRRSSAAWLAGAPEPLSPNQLSAGRPMPGQHGTLLQEAGGQDAGRSEGEGAMAGMEFRGDLRGGDDDVSSPVAGAKPENTWGEAAERESTEL